MEHTLTAKGAAFDPETRERVDPTGLGGIGSALCSCGWPSEVLPSGKQRINAHKAHKAEMAALSADESTEGDSPAEQSVEVEKPADDGEDIAPFEDPEADKARETETLDNQLGEQPEENTPEADFAEPVEEPVKGPFQAQRTFPGNYSIVMAPFAQLMADAASLWSEAETFKGKLERRVTFAGEQADVEAFLPVLDHEVEASLAALHAWQKEHREERRGQTDMQKFLANRGFLARFGEEAADRIRNA